jgi:hypothetical protein
LSANSGQREELVIAQLCDEVHDVAQRLLTAHLVVLDHVRRRRAQIVARLQTAPDLRADGIEPEVLTFAELEEIRIAVE